jgi:molecular chaperone DnaK (HSP70)
VNGIVHVSAVEKNTGLRQKIQINQAMGLSPHEIERLSRTLSTNDVNQG